MSISFDSELLATAGANLCGEDDFSVLCCEACDGQYLFNRELNDIYYQPDNLNRHFFLLSGVSMPPCRYCGKVGWQNETWQADTASIQVGPWAIYLSR
jgi:hypothetical protein